MAAEQFTRREVERAFRKFRDLLTDLMQARFQTWGDTFTHLIAHCEKNPVMRVVTEPLRANKNVDANRWYLDTLASVLGMVGSGRYSLPVDDDDRTALLYQLFLKVEYENINISEFCMSVYGTTNYQEMVSVFNEELVTKFAREMTYRLDEVLTDLGTSQEVPREAMLVFHFHDHSQQDNSMHITGPIQGSNVAVGGSSISNSSATYTTNAELAEALKGLKPLIREVTESQRDAVAVALDVLVEATQKAIPVAQVAQATDTLAKSSPSFTDRLKDITGKIGIGLLSSTLVQGIKAGLGIP
jgi:hypothetical protein